MIQCEDEMGIGESSRVEQEISLNTPRLIPTMTILRAVKFIYIFTEHLSAKYLETVLEDSRPSSLFQLHTARTIFMFLIMFNIY
uniref:Uncharacterized protein n=1 Tax=Heterorhabditis bacteriophora TaxID=37862 RepID=A0A1I7X0J5_HETBA